MAPDERGLGLRESSLGTRKADIGENDAAPSPDGDRLLAVLLVPDCLAVLGVP